MWTRHTAGSWSWVWQLGTTSLLVYWVHIEIVYGRWFGSSKGTMKVAQAVTAAVVLIVVMVGLREFFGEMRRRVVARPGATEGIGAREREA